ncbi:MAG TPA: hypothetical protein VD947_02440 [Patescibacteria group bacterium]|nr:hypothetical protein [Patescibacteria group bacterium]
MARVRGHQGNMAEIIANPDFWPNIEAETLRQVATTKMRVPHELVIQAARGLMQEVTLGAETINYDGFPVDSYGDDLSGEFQASRWYHIPRSGSSEPAQYRLAQYTGVTYPRSFKGVSLGRRVRKPEVDLFVVETMPSGSEVQPTVPHPDINGAVPVPAPDEGSRWDRWPLDQAQRMEAVMDLSRDLPTVALAHFIQNRAG